MKVIFLGDGAMTPDIMSQQVKTIGNITPLEIMLPFSTEELAVVEKVGVENMPVPAIVKNQKGLDDVEIAVVHFCAFGTQMLDLMPNLKILCTLRAGTENINLQAATERGIACINCPGRNAEVVSDQALALMLAEVYNVARQHADMMQGIWKDAYPTTSYTPILAGKKAGIIGFGNIGKLTAQKLQGFNILVSAYDPFVSKEVMAEKGVTKREKDEIFKDSDFVFIQARLDDSTRKSIGAHELSLMKPHSWFINNARAGLVDTDALITVLRERKISGAALDVFDIEPLPADSPFLTLDNVTLTPHCGGGSSAEVRIFAAKMVANGINSILANKPNFQVMNPDVIRAEEFQSWIKANENLKGC